MSAHTPGPWLRDGATVYTVPGSLKVIAEIRKHYRARSMDEEATANARLVTAAPDLLDALRDAQSLIRSHVETVSAETRKAVLDRIDAALTKARGQ